MLIKNDIPILEFDTDKESVLMPDHDKLALNLPERAVFVFLGDYVDEFAQRENMIIEGHFVSATKLYPIYRYNYKGEDICVVQAPVGAAPAAQLMDWLMGYGVRKIISAGSCGTLVDIEENAFLVPVKALRDEGTSYHYMPPSRFVDINKTAREAIYSTLDEYNIKFKEVMTWSTDGFYRETREKVNYRKSEGCEVVEMECSALAACAHMREAVWGMILYTADSLANLENHDSRDWGEASRAKAMELCLESVIRL